MEYVPGGVRVPGEGSLNKDDKDTTNSKLHGPSDNAEGKPDIYYYDINDNDNNDTLSAGPFAGTFRGCIWNCRSLWSKRNGNTIREALKLVEIHDFLVLLETRETETRRKYIEAVLPADYCFYSTRINAKKGGVAIIIKRAFLDRFTRTDWSVAVPGRVGKLVLNGPDGKLCIIAAY